MRFYELILTSIASGKIYRPPGFEQLALPFSYGSFVNGQTLPGALDIELDVEQVAYAVAPVGSWVRIHGVSLQEIAQAQDFNPTLDGATWNASLKVGMAPGLPLADPSQQGVIATGSILYSFGNWIGNDMTLEFVFGPNVGTPDKPVNITHNWPANTPLSGSLQQTLETAFHDFHVRVNISPDLVQADDDTGPYGSLEEYAAYIKQRTKALLGGKYQGVDITVIGDTILAFDQTGTQPTAKPVRFQDLVGQPTWLEPQRVSSKVIMRGDIQIGDYVTLPPTQITTTAQVGPFATSTIFQGNFLVQGLRSVGGYRKPPGDDSWVTIMDLAALLPD